MSWRSATRVGWCTVGVAGVLWPGTVAGPLDGAPLDGRAEALVIGLLLPALLCWNPALLDRLLVRSLCVALLAWKVLGGGLLIQDGWCLRFVTPEPVFVGGVTTPRAWDVRADWFSHEITCSAVMTRGYPSDGAFPAWFINLAPASFISAPRPEERPPLMTVAADVTGYLQPSSPGALALRVGADTRARVVVNGRDVTAEALGAGAALEPGLHHVSIASELSGSAWALVPTWNGRDLFRSTIATREPPRRLDRFVRPWGRYVAAVFVLAILGVALRALVADVRHGTVLAWVALVPAAAALAQAVSPSALRWFSVLPLALVLLRLPPRAQTMPVALLLVGSAWLSLAAAAGWESIGEFTLYSGGDDWWMFQRYAYRIFMQGYWLEGGQPVFWFQPLYRWIAGALHMVFGDSSVGELFWDAACALVGAAFAFEVTRARAGYRWGVVAATTTLAVFGLGPTWYFFGRGLSELSSMGFVYGAAIMAIRARPRHSLTMALGAGSLAVLAFYARLNNLPMALGVACFAWPLAAEAGTLRAPRTWIAAASRPVVAGVLVAMCAGVYLFAARTYYYTGRFDMLHGTQAGLLSLWGTGGGVAGWTASVMDSILMAVTLNDPARFDVRALPVMIGVAAAALGLAGVRPFSKLPLGASCFCLASLAGSLVARGSAYPGRFSIHVIPAAVAIAACAASLIATELAARAPAVARWISRPGGGATQSTAASRT